MRWNHHGAARKSVILATAPSERAEDDHENPHSRGRRHVDGEVRPVKIDGSGWS
jgi:hypothetical protein